MANETPKQKAIREAYGEHYERLKDEINQHGVFVGDTGMISDELFNQWSFIGATEPVNTLGIKKVSGSRPKSLSGIENNNGWTIYDEHPKSEQMAFFIIYEKNLMCVAHWDNDKKEFYSENLFIQNVSHYMPIERPKPPIY